ncbi:unnamed protein product [Durusdinium trenchii]|uniref:DNA replication factor Cdt1 C-terminal domain-containing protein n=2 Tax=Durusdinium trenchii TaxID=1381693 RepID=A0ABP0HBL5_9DINO
MSKMAVTPRPKRRQRTQEMELTPSPPQRRSSRRQTLEEVCEKPVDMAATPTKRKRISQHPELTATPPKLPRARQGIDPQQVAEKAAKTLTEEVQDVKETKEMSQTKAMLLLLFDGIETVLQLRASRYRITSFENLQQSVEASTARDLTTERLQQVLALAGGMLEAVWIGTENPYLSVEQRDKEGKFLRPEGAEVSERRVKFQQALAAVTFVGADPSKSIPSKPLPPPPAPPAPPAPASLRSESEPVAPEVGRVAAAKLSELAQLPSLRRTGSYKQRMEAVKARIIAKKAIVEKEQKHHAEFQRLLDGISACEDVSTAREILVHLFAQPGEGKVAVVAEKKILGALCSCSYAEQCTRMVSLEAGRAALAQLKELGEGAWFSVIPAQHSSDVFWRRIQGGNDAAVRATLSTKMRELQEEKRQLVSSGWCPSLEKQRV